jgi:hypothetical protein
VNAETPQPVSTQARAVRTLAAIVLISSFALFAWGKILATSYAGDLRAVADQIQTMTLDGEESASVSGGYALYTSAKLFYLWVFFPGVLAVVCLGVSALWKRRGATVAERAQGPNARVRASVAWSFLMTAAACVLTAVAVYSFRFTDLVGLAKKVG